MKFFNELMATIMMVFIFSPVILAMNGPHPADIVPSSYETEELRSMEDDIPLIHPNCDRSFAPEITSSFQAVDPYSYPDEYVQVDVDWCEGNTGELRYRLLELRGSPQNRRTHVLSSEVSSDHDGNRFYVDAKCQTQSVYVEVCARQAENARPLCSMTSIYKIQPFVLPEPRLAYRAPIVLQIAPGDSVKISNQIMNATSRDGPFGNGGYDYPQQRRFLIRSTVKTPKGRTLKKTSFREKRKTRIMISSKNTGKRTSLYNGSVVSMEYTIPGCTSNFASQYQYQTKIEISPNFKSLVKQDKKLPTFEQPKFTKLGSDDDEVNEGDTAFVEVVAQNPGGGMREGGVPTDLTYQWYLRDVDFDNFGPTYANALDGATGSSLTLPSVQCSVPDAGDNSVIGIYHYYVDVCNTFGCRRSNVIIPC